jgi:hypothetical protein
MSVFDVLKKENQGMVHPYDLIYMFTLAKESDDDGDLEMILAMSAMILSCNCRDDYCAPAFELGASCQIAVEGGIV